MSFQDDHKILVASVAAYPWPPDSSSWLMRSCDRFGITVTLLGQGQPYSNNWAKIRIVAHYLRDHPEYEFVFQVDFRDVVFCASLREIFSKYRAMGHSVVAAAERTCWPMSSYASRCPDTGTTFRYLNSGAIFSTSSAWLAAWDRMRATAEATRGRCLERGIDGLDILSCDQAAWSHLYIHKEADIVLDSKCELFQTLKTVEYDLACANRDLAFEGGRVVNRETGGRPCLVHANADVPVEPWGRYVLSPSVAWIWPLIDRIGVLPQSTLKDTAHLEKLLLDLGLHAAIDDDLPVQLLPFTGKGLAICRRPSEFASFLAWLANRPPVGSYVEIGAGNGGAFIATTEILNRLHPLQLAISVGPQASRVLLDYVARTDAAHHVRGNRACDALEPIAEREGHVDLVMIDAHGRDDCVCDDWDYAQTCSRYVAIHGVVAEQSPQARKLWEQIQASHRATYEFIDPTLTPEAMWGVGVVDLAYG